MTGKIDRKRKRKKAYHVRIFTGQIAGGTQIAMI